MESVTESVAGNRNIGGGTTATLANRILNGTGGAESTDTNNKKVGVVNRKPGQTSRSSASSQGSREELTLGRRDSSSTSSADEGANRFIEKRKVRPSTSRKQQRAAAVSRRAEEEDDERTDSADEEEGYGHTSRTPPTYSSGSGITFDSSASILKPLSPSMLTVGYGAELMMTRPPINQEDYTHVLMTSPHHSEGQGSSGGVATALSPDHTPMNHSITNSDEITPQVLAPTTLPTLSSLPNVGVASAVLNPVSTSIPAANALPFAGWWGQHTTPLYSPFCGPSGSVATTPVATDTTGLLRPGSNVLLRAVICQESDGVLTVNVHWRNKSYSGSLIDVSQHQWAPPRLLMEGFQEVPIQVKELYSKQESEKEAVDVIIDDREDMSEGEGKEGGGEAKAPPTNEITKDDTTDKLPVVKAPPTKTSDLLMKPPNGFKVPTVMGSSMTDKLKPVLPAFDAVKSPQPQIGREDTSTDRKRDPVGTTGDAPPHIPETHHNLNTLVDVAAKMKHVLNDAAPTSSVRVSDVVNSSAHPHTLSGNDSDSSGSGSISPLRKQQGDKEEHPITVPPLSATPTHVDNSALVPVPSDKQLISDRERIRRVTPLGAKQVGHSWIPPPPQDKKGAQPTPNIILGKPGVFEHHAHPPHPFSPHPPSVIQDKPKNYSKRKRPQVNEPNKRPSPPKDEGGSPPVGGPPIPPSGRPFEYSLIPGGQDHHMIKVEQQQPHPPPPGFQYDPSIPMSYHLQVVSYTREKAAEAGRNQDRATPPNKPPKRPHPSYEHIDSSRSPPGHAKRGGAQNKMSPGVGVVMQSDHRGHMPGILQPPQIKQEQMHHGNHGNRPSRPPSKPSHGGPHPSSSKTTTGHSSRKPHPPSRRQEHPVMIKQEPQDLHLPPGQHMLQGGHPFSFQPMSFPLVINSSASNATPHNMSWVGGVINNPTPSSSSQSHRRTPSDLPVPRPSSNRTPSPALNHHRKPPEWQSSHHMNPRDQSAVKQHDPAHRHTPGDKHASSSHGSSSSAHGHHGNKHDPSTRHILAPSHSLSQAQALSPSYIAELRNGVSINDYLKLMQLEALQKGSSIVAPVPSAAAATIHAPGVHPQELALWQNQMAQMAAMQQLQPIDQTAALQMQLALQQQHQAAAAQQQQQNDAVTQAFAAQGLFPFMQPYPLGTAQVLPFPSLTQPPKRDT